MRTYTYKEAILLIVNTRLGINEITLAIEVMACIGPGSFDNDLYDAALTELAAKREIIVIMYCVPSDRLDRMMSLFLPKGTYSIKVFE